MKLFSFKKNSPMDSGSLPDLSINPSASATNVDYTPLTKSKHSLNKKMIIGFGVAVSFILVGLTAFIATQSPLTTHTKAASNASGCSTKTVGNATIKLCASSVSQPSPDSAKAVFEVTKLSGDATETTFDVHYSAFWCDVDNGSHCGDNSSGDHVQTFHLTAVNSTDLLTINISNPDGACGSFQFDSYLLGDDPVVYEYLGTGKDCNIRNTPTPPGPVPTDTPIPIVTGPPPMTSITPSVTPSPTPTQSPSLARIAGRVALYGCASSDEILPNKSSCSPVASGKGKNGIKVMLDENGVDMGSTNSHVYDTDGTPGYFEFDNLQPGDYRICAENIPGAVFYCGVATQTAGNCSSFHVNAGQNATSKYLVFQQNPSSCAPGVSTPTPSTTPGIGSPSSTPTPTPTTTLTPSPTPTNTVVVITATPTPTTIVVVGATNTPTPGQSVPTTPVAQTTIPSAGSPLPYVAVAIPFILILIAFVL